MPIFQVYLSAEVADRVERVAKSRGTTPTKLLAELARSTPLDAPGDSLAARTQSALESGVIERNSAYTAAQIHELLGYPIASAGELISFALGLHEAGWRKLPRRGRVKATYTLGNPAEATPAEEPLRDWATAVGVFTLRHVGDTPANPWHVYREAVQGSVIGDMSPQDTAAIARALVRHDWTPGDDQEDARTRPYWPPES